MSEEKKLTDEETVKSLTFCTKSTCDDETTGDCPLKKDERCQTIMAINSLNLIHRLQDDYSKLKERYVKVLDLNEKVIAEQKSEIERLYKNIGKFKDAVRKETAEKFAKRLKEEFDYDEILCSTVDRIVKEITEGEGIEIYKQGFKDGVEALKIQAKERKFEIVTDAGNREDVVFVEDINEIVKELCE